MNNKTQKTMACVLLGMLVIFFPVFLFAKISPLVNFQGYITDKSGMPVADGSYDIKFSIYDGDDETASELWNEIQNVSVKNGFYTVSLGSVTAFKDPNRDTDESDALGFSKPYFLGIKVRKYGESTWDIIGFDARYLPLSSVWSAFRAKSVSGRLIAIKDQNTIVSDAEDMLLVVGQTRITLSSALNAAGRMITIKKVDPKGTIVTIISVNGETIDGVNRDPNDGYDPLELTEKYQEINLISDGRNWISTAGGGMSSTGSSGNITDIEPGSINTIHLADHVISTSKLANKSVTSEKLFLEDHSIEHKKIDLTNAITNSEIAPNAAIPYTKLQLDASIDTKDLIDKAVTAKKLALAKGDLSYSMINLTGLIINSDISENANIDYSKLNLNNALTDGDIAENASISHTKLDLTGISAADLLGSATIPYDNMQIEGRIKNSDISTSAEISYNKLNLTNMIKTSDLEPGAVTYPKLDLNNGDIPYAKISLNQSVIDADIAENANINYSKLDLQNKISTGDLLNGAVTANKIARDAVRSETILDKNITTDDLADSSVTAGKLNVSQEGTSGQVLSTDGIGGLFWQSVSSSGTTSDTLSKLTVAGHSNLNTLAAQSANITQVSIIHSLSANQADILTITASHINLQTLDISQTTINNLATEPRIVTIPDASGKILISGQQMVTSVELVDNAIENRHIGEGVIQGDNIASDAQISYSKLMLQNAIQNKDIANETIAYEKLNLADRIIPYTVLNLTGAIKSTDIASGAVSYSSLNLIDTIQSQDIQDGTILSQDLADNIIYPQKLSGIYATGNVKESLMSDGAGGFYWDEASPFESSISEIQFSGLVGGQTLIMNSMGVAVNSNGYIYVVQRSENNILVFQENGTTSILTIGKDQLEFQHRFDSPQGMAVDIWDNIYVVDKNNNRIQKFKVNINDQIVTFEASFGAGLLSDPYGVAVDNTGKVFIADTGNHQIKVFKADATLEYTLGGYGAEYGKFESPYDVAVDRSGNIFVLDSFNYRVQKFDGNRNFLLSFPNQNESPQNREIGISYGITVDDSGYVYVADTTNNRIQIFNNNGKYQKTITSALGDFNPKQLDVDKSGIIYVSDTNNDRVHIFKPEDPIYTVQSTTIGINTSNPYTATAMQIDSTKGGLLIPRMSSIEREEIKNPVQGLLVFQNDGHSGFYFYNDSNWINFDSNINDAIVTENKIASDAIIGAKVKDDSLTGDDIKNQSLSVSKLIISGVHQDGDMLVAEGDSLKWQAYDKLSRILTVGDGGQYTSISKALVSITDNSDISRYLIKVAPGTYNEQITLKPFVDIEGSGENQTILQFTGGNNQASVDSSSATVIGAVNCELRFLTISSQASGANNAVAVYNQNASPIFKHVTIKANGALQNNIAFYNSNSSEIPKIFNSSIYVSGGINAIGIQNEGADIVIRDSDILAESATTTTVGIIHAGSTAAKSEADNIRISAETNAVQVNDGTIWFSGSKISGGINQTNPGTAVCMSVYEVSNNDISAYQLNCQR